MAARHRLLLFVLLTGLTLGVCVQYDRADKWTSPQKPELNADIDAHDGETVLLFGYITELDRDERQMLIDKLSIQVDLTGTDQSTVDRGTALQVYGTVDAPRDAVTAERIVVDYENTGDWVYLSTTSILGVLVALGQFFRYWRPNLDRYCFEPRGDRRG